ncbi:hypothetical protein DFJ73DRAFT_296398 [Zopfochytrium polystomum]|nr:hypothetical protein DFJ73DRAFT_296398 [Zopfochytrium polystomum]
MQSVAPPMREPSSSTPDAAPSTATSAGAPATATTELPQQHHQHQLQQPSRRRRLSLRSLRVDHTAATPPSSFHVTGLPDELLIQAMANLSPSDLQVAALACKHWYRVINDDACWRSALRSFLGALPVRRIARSSWKNEYLRRFRLTRDWTRGSKHVIQFDPRVGRIADILVDPDDDRMLAVSRDNGIVSICNPITGKVDRDVIYFTDDRVPIGVSAVLLQRNRIIAAHATGTLSIVTNFSSSSGASAAKLRHIAPRGHPGGVGLLVAGPPSIPTVVLTAGRDDGLIRAWDVATGRCFWIGVGNSESIEALAFDAKHHVAAATASGSLCIWDVDLLSLVGRLPTHSSPSPTAALVGADIPAIVPATESVVARVLGAPLPSVEAGEQGVGEDQPGRVISLSVDSPSRCAMVVFGKSFKDESEEVRSLGADKDDDASNLGISTTGKLVPKLAPPWQQRSTPMLYSQQTALGAPNSSPRHHGRSTRLNRPRQRHRRSVR